jgi:hypothetical protein
LFARSATEPVYQDPGHKRRLPAIEEATFAGIPVLAEFGSNRPVGASKPPRRSVSKKALEIQSKFKDDEMYRDPGART